MTQREKHIQALNSFTGKVKNDPNVIALLVYGSLSYGTVWEKSDIDMEMIVRDGSAPDKKMYVVDEDGVEINFTLTEISGFKKYLHKTKGGNVWHSMSTLGTLAFTKDDSLQVFFDDLRTVGDDDARRSFAAKLTSLINWMTKALKHITVINDLLYSQSFLQLCGADVAELVLILNKEMPTRDSIRRAREINEPLMNDVFVIPSTTVMDEFEIRRVLKVIDDFILEHVEWWSRHIIKFLSDGEIKSCSHILRHCGGAPLEYLAEKGIVEKVTQPSRLFKHSKLTVEEVAYFYLKEEHKNV